MQVKFVIAMEIDDTFEIDDDTGEKLKINDLIDRLKECLTIGDIPFSADEIIAVEIEH